MNAAGQAGLNVVEIDSDELSGCGDLLSRTHDGDVDLIIVHRWFAPDTLAGIVHTLENRDLPVFRMEIPPRRAGLVLGHPLDLTRDLDAYFRDAEAFCPVLRELFAEAEAGDFETRAAELLSSLSGGRPARVMVHGDGRRYLPATIRCLAPGGHIRIHCEDQKLGEPAKQRIREVARPRVSSFYLMMSPPESGGELTLYDLTWSQVDATHLADGRCEPDGIKGRYAKLDYAMAAGDVALFGNGRIHEVQPVAGVRNRWTMGGFFTISRDDENVFYFS